MSLIGSLKEMQEEQFLLATGECAPHSTHRSASRGYYTAQTQLAPESRSSVLPKSTLPLWETSLGLLSSTVARGKKSNNKK